jgi:co-chaperonin GroES (HSP10)
MQFFYFYLLKLSKQALISDLFHKPDFYGTGNDKRNTNLFQDEEEEKWHFAQCMIAYWFVVWTRIPKLRAGLSSLIPRKKNHHKASLSLSVLVSEPKTVKVTPLDVKPKDKVLFGKWSGNEVTIDGEELLIMKESDILGIID